ncbi:MAG: hypothetical protein ACJ76D_04460 [Solirubrobacterales bacterium]
MESQRKQRDLILASFAKSPVSEAFAAQHQRTRDQLLSVVGKSPALAAITGRQHEWRDQILKAFKASSVFDSLNLQQQERHRQLVEAIGKSPALEQVFANWKVTLPPGLVNQMAVFQIGMLTDIAAPIPDTVEGEADKVWFGAESWARLVWEMVAILKCVELMTAGMTGAKMELNAPTPRGVIYLLAIFIAAGELAAHFAQPAAERRDEQSEFS